MGKLTIYNAENKIPAFYPNVAAYVDYTGYFPISCCVCCASIKGDEFAYNIYNTCMQTFLCWPYFA